MRDGYLDVKVTARKRGVFFRVAYALVVLSLRLCASLLNLELRLRKGAF